MKTRSMAVLFAALAVAATACGTPQGQPPPSLSTPSTTTTTSLVPDPGNTGQSGGHFPPGWRLVFEAGEGWGPDGHGAGSYWESRLLAGEDGLLVTATGEGDETNVIDTFRSIDGTDWEQVDSVLGSLGIEFFDLALAGPDGFVLGGLTFEGEDDMSPWFVQSTDGRNWTDLDTESGLGSVVVDFIEDQGSDAGIYGSIASVVRFRDGYAAGGSFESQAMVWRSDDGLSWDAIPVAEGFDSSIAGLAVANGRLYAVGSSPFMTVWESTDGTTWSEIAGPAAFGIEGSSGAETGESGDEFFEEGFHSGNFIALAPYQDGLAALISVQRRRGQAWCYVDANSCMRDTLELVTSTDGREWQALPLPDDQQLGWGTALAEVDGTVILAETSDGRLQIWATEDLGTPSPIEVPVLPELGFDIVPWGATLEEGVTYGYPFWTHCGIDRIGTFNGQAWNLIEDTSDDLPDEEWAGYWDMLYGTIELVAPDRIEYTVAGVVIATYAPDPDPEDRECA